MPKRLRSGRELASPPPPWGGARRRGRPRRRLDVEEDLISLLPDELLLKVLAGLRCAREAARTGVLSRRWRRLWTGLRDLVFRGVEPRSVVAALDRVASSDPELRLDRRLRFVSTRGGRELGAERVPSLLRAADRLGASEVDFWGLRPCEAEIELPCLQRATSMVLPCDHGSQKFRLAPTGDFASLETLDCCNVDLGAFLPRCPSLRSLYMEGVSEDSELEAVTAGGAESKSLEELCLDGGCAGVALSGFPRLRKLEMIGRTLLGGETVTVESKSLEVLILCFHFMLPEGFSIHIVAPELQHFDFQCAWPAVFTMSLSAPKLEVLRLHYPCYRVGCGNRKWWLSSVTVRTERSNRHGQGQLPRVHVLSLFIRRATMGEHEPPAQRTFGQELARLPVTDFSALELTLQTEGHVCGGTLLQLLRIQSYIQRLKVHVYTTIARCSDNCDCDEENGNWRDEQISLPHLRVVEFDGFYGDDHELDFLQLLFRSAPMLKKMTIKPYYYGVGLRNRTCQKLNNIGSGACQKLQRIFAENASVECSFMEGA